SSWDSRTSTGECSRRNSSESLRSRTSAGGRRSRRNSSESLRSSWNKKLKVTSQHPFKLRTEFVQKVQEIILPDKLPFILFLLLHAHHAWLRMQSHRGLKFYIAVKKLKYAQPAQAGFMGLVDICCLFKILNFEVFIFLKILCIIFLENLDGQGDERSEEVIFDHLHATNYIATHYTASRMVITAAGNVKHEDIVEQAKKLFSKLSTDPTTTNMLVSKQPASFTGSEVRIIDDDMPLAQFAVAFNGASWVDPDSVALMVMQTMLGSWNKSAGGGKHMGSELVQRAAINDIAESVMGFNTNYKDTGLFGVYAVAKADCLDDLAFAIMHEMSKLSYRVTEEDVIRARNQLKSSIQLHLDGSTAVVEDIGRQLLTYGRRIPTPELFARIDAVDASTVKRVANRFIFDQ
ncbi:hypothetical protein ACJX0J_038740, partial [Zea mays]